MPKNDEIPVVDISDAEPADLDYEVQAREREMNQSAFKNSNPGLHKLMQKHQKGEA